MEKEQLPAFFAWPIVLCIATTHIIFYVSLLVPLAATVSFDLSNFDQETKITCSPNQEGICLQGDAFVNQGLQLTKNQLHASISSSVGRAAYSRPVRIWDSATRQMGDFTTQFSFIIHDVDLRRPSGDGLAFFLSSYPSVIPNNSAGGFLGLLPNSSRRDGHGKLVAIEFDTYPNNELDSVCADHIGINVNSMRSVVCLTLDGGIKKRTTAKAWVRYNANRQTLNVTLTTDDASVEGHSNLSYVIDLREVLPEYVSIGFSAATGTLVETHTILSWSFDSNLDVRGKGTPTVIVAGALMVGIMLVWLFMCNWRTTVTGKVGNAISISYGVLPSEKNEKKKDEDINIDAVHVSGRVEKGEITGVDTVLTEGNGQELTRDEDIGLDAISLVEGEGRQTDVINSYSGPLTEEDEGREVDVGSDGSMIKEGGGSQVEAPTPLDLWDGWSPKEIPYHVLLSATNNFSEEMMLGKGGFGPVYRGFLSDLAVDVAIKKLSERSEQGKPEYMAEVKIITQLRHRNLVKLIGWCHEHGDLMLVYEFMPNGSLDNHLFKEKNLLEWSVRYKIVLGLANALMYLHDECEPYVLHRDVKSSNILLDSKFDAKLADFGLARHFNLDISSLRVSHPAGTRGYWAPEYALMLKASRRSDIYSFGVVALEIACGKKAIIHTTQGEDGRSDAMLLVEWVWELYGKGAILDAADKRLSGNFDRPQMERLLVMGLYCAHPDDRQRPSIRQASNALLYPETIPLPTLPAKMPPWYFPLDHVQIQMVQLSSTPLPSPTLSTSDDPMSSLSQHGRRRNRNLSTSAEQPMLSRKLKSRFFAQFKGWMTRKKATSFDRTLEYKKNIMATGLREFSYNELVQATDNFSLLLGRGGFSDVYKGQLVSGMTVAVKRYRLIESHHYSIKEFMTEVMTLGHLAHKNLVKLIGWCLEHGRCWLVYEYMANGALDRHLFGDLIDGAIPWERRYKVVLSLASVLCYLHNDCHERCVLHRDVHPRNMFLDEDFNMKLGGFALARQTDHVVSLPSTLIVGTVGYMAPEYMLSGRYTTVSDVYGFGVVALEIACGRRSLHPGTTHGYDSLVQWVWHCYANVNLLEASDKNLMGNFDSREMQRLMVVGLWCTHCNPAQRPQMATVLRVLQSEEESPLLVHADRFIPTTSLGGSSSVSSVVDSDEDESMEECAVIDSDEDESIEECADDSGEMCW